jgi:Ca2+-binding EF-hand superfamily protein
VTDTRSPQFVRARTQLANSAAEHVLHATFYNPPFLQPYVLASSSDGLIAVDVSLSKEPVLQGVFRGVRDVWVAAVEEFPLDRMVAPNGGQLKDVSHASSRWLRTPEIQRILGVDAEALGLFSRYEQLPSVVSADARAVFKRADVDRSGLVTGEERASLPASADQNGDGRITLAELVEFEGAVEDEAVGRTRGPDEARPMVVVDERVQPDGDLARLFDGVDPFEHDKKRDGKLDRKELSSALFAALDLDRDGKLSPAELSRHPGPLRELRYGDASSLARFGKIDRTGGGSIGPKELSVRDEEWLVLDSDGDGFVQLDPGRDYAAERRGDSQVTPEWPTRRRGGPLALAPTTDEIRLLGVLDADGDGSLTKRELRRRPDLLQQLDRDGDDRVSPEEIAAGLGRLADQGAEVAPDSFELRWDLDGDGKVSEAELPERVNALLARRAR